MVNGSFPMKESIKIIYDGKVIGELEDFKPSNKEYPKCYTLGIDGYCQMDKNFVGVGEISGSIYYSK